MTASTPTDAIVDTSILRTFAVILCSKCQYLEFPGCDVHGTLYTELLIDGLGKQHAKCPNCTAATSNARPFRDGCRRCKSPTTVLMWASSLQEIQQAVEAFPNSIEEIEHTVISCECCCTAIFPKANHILTTRLAYEPLAVASGKPLKVANFQLSMPHVDGCSRKGMPLQAVAVQLPKSELKFIAQRMFKCPVAPKITGKEPYRHRPVGIITQQNHLHQIAIRLMSTVVKTFDAESPQAAQPLQQIITVLEKLEPLALFSEWSPPCQLSREKLLPKKLVDFELMPSSIDANNGISMRRIFESNFGFWRSSCKVDRQLPKEDEWIVLEFDPAVTLSTIELQWREGYIPKHYSVSASRDGTLFETVAIVMRPTKEDRMLIPKGFNVMAIKIVMFSSGKGETFGLISIVCKEAIFCSVHTPTVVVLQMVRQWLFNGAVSSLPEVRNLALQALQKLLLASGSLCGLLQLATSLVLNTRSTNVATFDRQTWDCFDQLSEDGSRSAQVFIIKLVTSIQRFVVKNRSDSVTLTNCLNDQEHVAINNGTSNTLMASSIEQQSFLKAIERRSHLGMIILHILSELSTWQMKRIQKAEEFKTEQELESLQLEEPYSMEICSDFFDISHRLIVSVLSRWLPRAGEKIQNNSRPEEGNKEGSNIVSSEIGSSQDVYDALASSFAQFRFNADMQGNLNGVDACIHQCNGDQSGKPMFLPEELCVAVLKIVTANLRRLVFSKIDPIEVGIAPARVQSEDDLLSAPPALAPTVCLLEQLISLGAMRNDSLFPVSLNAAVAMEVGTEAFYPSAYQRTKILTSRMGKGATLEVQMRWPVKERGQEDPRYERLLLMLQVECIKLRIRHAIRGSWYFFLHLMVEIPSSQETEEMLTRCFAPCIKSAGFLSWQVAAGAQELPINLQRHLYWNRKEKMSQDSGVGWIRVYPKSVAAYDDVLQDVEGFLAKHGNNDGSMLRP